MDKWLSIYGHEYNLGSTFRQDNQQFSIAYFNFEKFISLPTVHIRWTIGYVHLDLWERVEVVIKFLSYQRTNDICSQEMT